MNLKVAIDQLKQVMIDENLKPEDGLGTELFLFTTTLVPLVNIDILLIDNEGRFILSWRDDQYCGKGWHIPGGCIRLKEKMLERVHACAIEEFGTDVDFVSEPVFIGEGINNLTFIKERCHSISILYICKICNISNIKNLDGLQEEGHLRWFTNELPDNLVYVQNFYKDNWLKIRDKMEEIRNVKLEKRS